MLMPVEGCRYVEGVKKMKRKIFSFLICLIIMPVIGPGCSQTTQSENVDDTTIALQTEVGQTFLIKLPSNPTTGYSWQLLSLPPDSIHLQNKTFKQDRLSQISAGQEPNDQTTSPQHFGDSEPNTVEPELVGVGGMEIWTFKALKADSFELLFEYRQPWEKNIPAAEKKIVKINIRDIQKPDGQSNAEPH